VSDIPTGLPADLDHDRTRRARQLALGVCLAAGFTTLLDSSIVNLAVPSLARALHASTEEVQWLLASYSLTFGLALVPGAGWATCAGGARCSSAAWGCSQLAASFRGWHRPRASSSSRGYCKDRRGRDQGGGRS
jgi:MFS family permease